VSGLTGHIHIHVHVVGGVLTFFQVHITETRLQGLGTDRENQE